MRWISSLASLWLAGALLAGWGVTLPLPSSVVALSVAAIGLGFLAARSDAWAHRARTATAVLLVLCAGAAANAGLPEPPSPLPLQGSFWLECNVTSSVGNAAGARALANCERGFGGVSRASRAPLTGPARMRIEGVDVLPGSRLRGWFAVQALVDFRNPTPHPPWPDADAPIGLARTRGESSDLRVEPPNWPRATLELLRRRVREGLLATLEPEAAAVARALVLGDNGTLEASDSQAVRASGLAHVLAVSGMHVTLAIGLLVAVLRRALARFAVVEFFPAGRLAHAIGVPLALFYAAFAGGAPSAWRAGVTAALAWTLAASGRRPDAPAVAAVAVLVFGVVAPERAIEPGAVLSIVATAAVLGASRQDGRGVLVRAAETTARATIATAPVVWWNFGSVPAITLVANLVLAPLGGLVLLPLALVHAALAAVTPSAAELTGSVFEVGTRAFLEGARVLGSVPLGRNLPPLSLAQGVVVTAVAAILLLSTSRRGRAIAVALGVALATGAELRLRHDEQPRDLLRVTFVDVGQGDAAIVDFPNGEAMLIDAGGSATGNPYAASRAILPLLAARRRTELAVAVLTHPHPDHYGGFSAILDRVRVGELWDNGQAAAESDAGAVAELLTRARALGVRVREPGELCGRPRHFGRATVEMLHPCPAFDAGEELNDNSLVLQLSLGARRFLLAGDIEARGEARLLVSGVTLAADVLKVPHHGSRTSSGAGLLAAVHPILAVVSAGYANRFGHPHEEPLRRLLDGVPFVARTDWDGGVIVETDGISLHARTWSGREIQR